MYILEAPCRCGANVKDLAVWWHVNKKKSKAYNLVQDWYVVCKKCGRKTNGYIEALSAVEEWNKMNEEETEG